VRNRKNGKIFCCFEIFILYTLKIHRESKNKGDTMNKKLLFVMFFVLWIIFSSGCSQSVSDSEKFEGIPIFPEATLVKNTRLTEDYIERYETADLNTTFEELKEFYMEHIDKNRWSIEENIYHKQEENRFIGTIGYILRDKEREVSLILTKLKKNEEGNGPLQITINGNPLKEGKLQVHGLSKHWEIALEYTIMKNILSATGQLTYIGDTPPKELDYDFTMYQTSDEKLQTKGERELNGFHEKFDFGGGNHRQVDLEVIKEAINNATFELKWVEKGTKLKEIIDLNVVETSY